METASGVPQNAVVIGLKQETEELPRMDSSARMDVAAKKAVMLPVTWVISGICCFWLPLCCFLAAANVLPSCEKLDMLIGEDEHLDDYLKTYSLMVVLTGPVFQTFITCAAYSGNKFLFKYAEWAHFFTSIFQLGLMIRGWMHYANTSDENCYDDAENLDHYINPRKMLFGILVAQAVCSGLMCCLMCCFVGALIKKAGEDA